MINIEYFICKKFFFLNLLRHMGSSYQLPPLQRMKKKEKKKGKLKGKGEIESKREALEPSISKAFALIAKFDAVMVEAACIDG